MARPTTDGLKIGDLITLKDGKFECYLGAEGILSKDLYVTNTLEEFDDTIFQVHSKRQYSASRELESFLETNNIEEHEENEHLKQYLKALKKGRDNEVRLNDAYLEQETGVAVYFGQTVQLYHLKSRKYLLIDPKKLARCERENSSVELDPNGNTNAWIQFMPRRKIDREGDRILTNSEVFILIAERSNEYIHCADKSPKPGSLREVNCSLEQTPWRLSVFQSCLENVEMPSMVLASKLIYIHDPEFRTNLSVGEHQVESFDEVQEEEEGGFYHDDGDIISTTMGEVLNMRSIWTIETKALVRGGSIQWKTDQVRFKNLATGVFLSTVDPEVLPLGEDDVTKTEDGKKMILTTSSDLTDPGTLFNVVELNSTKNQLTMSKALQVYQGDYWLSRGVEIEEGSYAIRMINNKDKAISVLVNEYNQFSVESGPDSEEASTSKSGDPLDAFTGMSFKRILWKYLNMTIIPKRKNVTSLWPTAEASDIEFFQLVTTRAKNFSQGFAIADDHITLGVDKGNQLLRVQRQNLLRELGIIEVTLRIINRLKPVTSLYDRSQARGQPLADSDLLLLEFGNNILSQLLDLVYYCILDNAGNQMFVADYLPDLLAHLSTQPLAGKCVTAMLSANMDLQEDKINKSVLSIFVEKLKNTQMARMYLNLLQSCCSCQGQGVDGNQCDVAELLFEDSAEGVLIEPKVNSEVRSIEKWDESIYVPKDAVSKEMVIEGYELITKGLPEISIVWVARDDYSVKTLFNGKEMVNVREAFPRNLNMMPTKDLDKKRLAVAQYFIDEMLLGAEMCMDRNYVSMHCLDPLFSFEVLVAIMKMANLHNSLKASACRLLFCLHIDRDPQACTKIPCLTRTWQDVVGSEEPKLPSVAPERQYVYGLVQQLCSEHVRGMSGHRWDIYSRSILQMLRGLIGFNFYGTVERLNDVIGPMVHAIDRRLVDYSDAKTGKRKGSVSVLKIDGQDILVDRELTWQKRHYDLLESLPMMSAILILVLAAVAVTIYQVVEDINDSAGFLYFGLAVLAVFLYDFFMRMYCYWYVYQELMPFLRNPYNIIDMFVILIDVVFLAIPSSTVGSEGGIAKSLRLVRLVRLVRVLRAVKVIDAITKDKNEVVKWNAPIRYSKIPMFELETMTEAISLLLFVQGVIEDRNLSILLHYFHDWQSGKDSRSPPELFEQALEDSNELSLDVNDLNHVLIDALMFVHTPLVQGALNVLMAHHSSKESLLRNAEHAQIIVSSKRQKEFVNIREWVSKLEQNAETHELWGELESDEDHVYNKQTKEFLRELIACVRVRRYTFEYDEDFEPVTAVQDMLRNLGIYDITPKVLGLMDSVEEGEEGEFSDVAKNTMDICTLCNELLYWSTIGNQKNQEILYENLEDFLDSLADGINSHKVVKAIFKGNETLMGLVPDSLLNNMVSNICNEGHSHVYLALASSITHVGEKNITKNQFEIIRGLCNPEKLEETAVFIVPVDHDDYFEKKRLMAPFKDTQDVDIDSLPAALAYHLQYLEVLSNCTSGKINISAVEAKVQSIYSLKDIIEAILDEDTILIARIRLSQFLLNSIIDVEMALPGLTESKYMWDLLESYLELMSFAKDEVRNVEKLGWESPEVSRHRIEYLMTAIQIIGSFFNKNYSAEKMRAEDGTASEDRVSLSMARVNDIIHQLFDKIFEVYDLDTPRLTTETKAQMYDCLNALNKSATAVIVTGIEPIHLETAGVDEVEPEADEVLEISILDKYKDFCDALKENEDVQESAQKEVDNFIELIEELPSITDKAANSDIRVEPFLQKLVNHVRENIVVTENDKKLETETTRTTLWMIKAFRTWIENKMEMSIDDRDEDGGDEEDEKAGPTVLLLNNNGVTALCIELIAPGIDETLQSEVVKLMVGMLFKEGGAREVQSKVHECLVGVESVLFFKQLRVTIQKLIAWHEWHGVIVLEDEEDPEPPEDIRIIRMLQLLCEGHYGPNQDILRDQPKNVLSINLLDDFATYFNVVSKIPCRTSTAAAQAVGDVIVEVIQGPCVGNQIHFALNTEVLETINRVLRSEPVNDCDKGEDNEVKMCCMDTISALLEGQKPNDAVTVRILSVLHLDILLYLATPKIPEEDVEGEGDAKPKLDDDEDEGDGGDKEEEEEEEEDDLQTNSVVLLQMLCDYRPSIREEIENESDGVFDFEQASAATASIEVNWNGVLNRRFFHIPDVCDLLSKPSKDKLVQDIDRSNTENRLLDFLDRAKHLYLEIKHQEFLTELGLAGVFSPDTQNKATWFTFALAIIINVLFVVYYDATHSEPDIPKHIRTVVNVLNYIQISTVIFTIILNFVVRSPVIYQGFVNEDENSWMAMLYTGIDGMTLYYLWYLLFACLGAFYADIYISYLLLDLIVKNPTTADILDAVVIPRNSLIVAFIMGAFVIYIYTFFIFIYMPYRITADDDMTPGGMEGDDCVTLWGCYKYVFAYGFRAGGGVGEVMYVDVGDAAWLHLTFFLVVTVAMLNIIFGIIIDTFSGLRSEKNERAFKTTETCFVCSLGRQVFDRAANSPEGFKRHIREDHHMWNYLFFIFFLWEQDKDDDDGLEYYVRHKIIDNEITWFPMDTAMCLDLGETDHEVMRGKLMTEINGKEKELLSRLGDMEGTINVVLDNISAAISRDYSNASSIKEGIADYISAVQNGEVIDEPVLAIQRNTSTGQDLEPTRDGMNLAPRKGTKNLMVLVLRSVNLPGVENVDQLDSTVVRISSPAMIGSDSIVARAFEVHKDSKIIKFDDSGAHASFDMSVESAFEMDDNVTFAVVAEELIIAEFSVPIADIAKFAEVKEWEFKFSVGGHECFVTMVTSSMPVD